MTKHTGCKAIAKTTGELCNGTPEADGYCYRPTHKAQRGEVYRQFAFDGINTADVYETPLNVPLPLSQRLGGAKGVEKAREALEATKVSDPMKTKVQRGPLTIDTIGKNIINKENSK